ncbi:O-acyltransferase WSD1 [Bienertia sinuspersici]
MNCAMKFKHPINIQAFKKAFSNSILINHPRFCSLIVRNPNNGGEYYWEKTHVNIDDHFIIHYYPTNKSTNNDDDDNDDGEVNAYLADIAVSTPLSEKKPLWEVHVLLGLKCVVLRVHHSLGDGFL